MPDDITKQVIPTQPQQSDHKPQPNQQSTNNTYWTYWDFVLPFRIRTKKIFTKIVGKYLLLQYVTVFLYLIILFSLFTVNFNKTGGIGLFAPGRNYATLGEFLAFVGYFVIARFFWSSYDKEYQRQ